MEKGIETVKRSESQFDLIKNRIQHLSERIDDVTADIRSCANQLNGAEPLDAPTENKGGGSDSIFASIGLALIQLESATALLEHERKRLKELF